MSSLWLLVLTGFYSVYQIVRNEMDGTIGRYGERTGACRGLVGVT
jgi:hypothetical protein